ncbi:MAG: glycosyltransferase [Anaerolineae bacterium]|nr:glycosyltransferase [Anaerolineae bacterium]MDW8172009.1 glycosyltransferase family 2 protein [Anaerolineae bacterium]
MTLVSIVAPVYNGADFIEESIQSVLGQTYPRLEYIIMDGGSQDGTVEIAQRYAALHPDKMTVVSERDSGQSNAINKGWQRAKGDVLTWLNADDLYLPDTVEQAVRYFQAHPQTAWLYGCPRLVNADGTPNAFRHHTLPWNYDQLLKFGCYITQPTVFLRREVVDQCGLIDESLHYGMDYDYWLRIGKRYPAAFVPQVRAIVKIFPETKSRSGGYKRLLELEQIVRRHGGAELPATLRHQWVEGVLDELARAVRVGQWSEFQARWAELWRYPRWVGHGTAKWLLRRLPSGLERCLRRRLVKDPYADPDDPCAWT